VSGFGFALTPTYESFAFPPIYDDFRRLEVTQEPQLAALRWIAGVPCGTPAYEASRVGVRLRAHPDLRELRKSS